MVCGAVDLSDFSKRIRISGISGICECECGNYSHQVRNVLLLLLITKKMMAHCFSQKGGFGGAL